MKSLSILSVVLLSLALGSCKTEVKKNPGSKVGISDFLVSGPLI